jgi:hypothetical protein
LWWAWARYSVLNFISQTTRCSFSYSVGRQKVPSHPFGVFCWFFPLPQDTKSPAFLLYLVSFLLNNSLMLPFFLCYYVGWGNQGTPLCHWSRYEDEKVKLHRVPALSWTWNRSKQDRAWAYGPSSTLDLSQKSKKWCEPSYGSRS